MRHATTVLPLLFLTVLLSGCYTSRVRVMLEADGSGTLVLTHTATTGLLSFLSTRFQAAPEDTFFTEDQLKAAEGDYGDGVRFVRRNVFATDDGKAFLATYRFDNINDLRLGSGSAVQGLANRSSEDVFTFRLEGSLLTVTPPDLNSAAPSQESPDQEPRGEEQQARQLERFEANRSALMRDGNPFKLRGTETQEELAETLLQGTQFRVELTLPGPIRATNAGHVETNSSGNGILVLLDLQPEHMLESETLRDAFAENRIKDLSVRDLAGVPGVIAETNGAVRVLYEVNPAPLPSQSEE